MRKPAGTVCGLRRVRARARSAGRRSRARRDRAPARRRRVTLPVVQSARTSLQLSPGEAPAQRRRQRDTGVGRVELEGLRGGRSVVSHGRDRTPSPAPRRARPDRSRPPAPCRAGRPPCRRRPWPPRRRSCRRGACRRDRAMTIATSAILSPSTPASTITPEPSLSRS